MNGRMVIFPEDGSLVGYAQHTSSDDGAILITTSAYDIEEHDALVYIAKAHL